jgi:hypothetical protein
MSWRWVTPTADCSGSRAIAGCGGAQTMGFGEGALWSEDAAGTNAPGTALAIDEPVQIRALSRGPTGSPSSAHRRRPGGEEESRRQPT